MSEKQIRNICHVTSVHNRYDARIFGKECTSLAKAGYRTTLLVNDNLPDEIINNVKIVSSGLKPKNRIEHLLKSTFFLKNKIKEIDAELFHLHDPDLLLISLWLKKRQKKVIFDSHEFYYLQIKEKKYIPKIFRTAIAQIYKIFEEKVFDKIDAIIFPCTINGEIPFKKHRSKVTLIDNYPLLKSPNEFNLKFEKKACYIGGLTYERGITHLIKAAYNANVKLVLCGKFSSEEYFNELKMMPEYSIVDYRGFLGKKDLISIMSECSVGICTLLSIGQYNKTDNFATKVLEYFYLGIPTIVSRYSFSEKIINQYDCGITVDPENIEELTESILLIVNNKDQAVQMGKNGKRLVENLFNWEREEQKLLNLYDTLL